jgi:hypothetical protein
MPTQLLTVIALLLLSMPVLPQAQESAGEVADTVPGEAAGQSADAVEEVGDEAEAEDEGDDADDSDLDEQTYEEDDDDFVPTEEIPADEPIPFPSNI